MSPLPMLMVSSRAEPPELTLYVTVQGCSLSALSQVPSSFLSSSNRGFALRSPWSVNARTAIASRVFIFSSFLGVQLFDFADLHRSVVFEDRAAFGDFRRLGEAGRLDDQV